MKEMSQTVEQYSAEIKANGLLVVDGQAATLAVKKNTKDASGTDARRMDHGCGAGKTTGGTPLLGLPNAH